MERARWITWYAMLRRCRIGAPDRVRVGLCALGVPPEHARWLYQALAIVITDK